MVSHDLGSGVDAVKARSNNSLILVFLAPYLLMVKGRTKAALRF